MNYTAPGYRYTAQLTSTLISSSLLAICQPLQISAVQTSPWKPQNTPPHLIHTADADATLIAIATAVTSIIFIIINPTHLQAPNASSSTLTHQVVIEVGEYISETVH